MRQFISHFIGLLVIGLFIYFSLGEGKLINRIGSIGIALILFLFFISHIMSFLFSELKQLTVAEIGIEIKYMLTKKVEFIPYNEIRKFVTRRVTSQRGVGRTAGYQQLEILLSNNKVITFNEDQFDNYSEIKNLIYHYRQNIL